MGAVPGFNVDVRRYGSTVVVAPIGEVDMATVAQLRVALREADGCGVLVLDLRGVDFIDSAGLSLVVDEHRRAVRDGVRFRLVRGSREVQGLFEMTGLARRLPFIETERGNAADAGVVDT